MGWRKRPAVIKKDPANVSVKIPYNIAMDEITSKEVRAEDSNAETVTTILSGDLNYE